MYVCVYTGDEIRALQKSLVDYSYQLTQLHQQLTTADRQRSTLQAKILSDEIMQQQVRRNSGQAGVRLTGVKEGEFLVRGRTS